MTKITIEKIKKIAKELRKEAEKIEQEKIAKCKDILLATKGLYTLEKIIKE